MKRREEQIKQRYLELNREVKKKIREAKRNYEIKIAREAKDNPKGFYQLYRSIVKKEW